MEHILSLSYGKDSLSCIGAIEELALYVEDVTCKSTQKRT